MCTCQHAPLCHRYEPAARANTGACLARECGCAGYEEEGKIPAQNKTFGRASEGADWDNRGTCENGPGTAANGVIPGPRRLTRSRLMADYGTPNAPRPIALPGGGR